jgi:hypothetical protein
MRKLIVTEFVTLDGVMEAPGGEPGHPHSGWVFDYMSPEQEQYKLEEALESESHLLGRVTYQSFAETWPQRSGEFADHLNAMPKQRRLLDPLRSARVEQLDPAPGQRRRGGRGAEGRGRRPDPRRRQLHAGPLADRGTISSTSCG